jgi:TRAP-type C4-dicarboxylate transport system permease small subunit
MRERAARLLGVFLETVCVALIVTLAAAVIYSVVTRALGNSPGWYDEIASTLLAWISWFGIAFATLRGGHMTVEGLLVHFPLALRKACFWIGELVVHATLLFSALAGVKIVETLAGETLVSLPEVPRALVQAVLPVGCLLAMAARVLAAPRAWSRIMSGTDADMAEIDDAIRRAEEMHAEAKEGHR